MSIEIKPYLIQRGSFKMPLPGYVPSGIGAIMEIALIAVSGMGQKLKIKNGLEIPTL